MTEIYAFAVVQMIQIIPAILSTKEEDFKRDIERLNNSEDLKNGWVHIDFMDNKFVPNLSITPEIVGKYKTTLKKEAHLMIESPLDWIDGLVEVGFERIIFHFEMTEDLAKCISLVKSKEIEVGVALKDETSLEKLEPFLDKIDVVLIMGVEPGFQGQPFLVTAIEKVKVAAGLRLKNPNLKVAVDGAVRDENAKALVEAGVDQLVAGSFLLKGEIDDNYQKIIQAINS